MSRRSRPGLDLAVREIDVLQTQALTTAIAGHDVVVSAFNPGKDGSGRGTVSIVEAVKAAGVPRLLVVGGAGSLEIAPGKKVIDQPDFPAEWKDGAMKTSAFLDALKAESSLNWTFLSPAAHLEPGPRTAKFRIGQDALLTDDKGQSRVSTADLAVALIDEAEHPAHSPPALHGRLLTTAKRPA